VPELWLHSRRPKRYRTPGSPALDGHQSAPAPPGPAVDGPPLSGEPDACRRPQRARGGSTEVIAGPGVGSQRPAHLQSPRKSLVEVRDKSGGRRQRRLGRRPWHAPAGAGRHLVVDVPAGAATRGAGGQEQCLAGAAPPRRLPGRTGPLTCHQAPILPRSVARSSELLTLLPVAWSSLPFDAPRGADETRPAIAAVRAASTGSRWPSAALPSRPRTSPAAAGSTSGPRTATS
jgi:hypothetical protein